MILRIGVWFDARHICYGGPAIVLLGTILGFLQDAEARGKPVIILLNEPGDVNWFFDSTEDLEYALQKAPNPVMGPICFSASDAEITAPMEHWFWKTPIRRYVIASEWFRWWVRCGLPFNDHEAADGRQLRIWRAGVDTEFFRPANISNGHFSSPFEIDSQDRPPADSAHSQDYFIYFKSQNWEHMSWLHSFLFKKHFGLTGTVMVYYNYDPTMLREAAQRSRFCILLDKPETQGLASLEIMACGCPLFVLDTTEFRGQRLAMQGATSVTCWDQRCGLRSTWETLEKDFPRFLDALPLFRPREFVEEGFGFIAAARNLRELLEDQHWAA